MAIAWLPTGGQFLDQFKLRVRSILKLIHQDVLDGSVPAPARDRWAIRSRPALPTRGSPARRNPRGRARGTPFEARPRPASTPKPRPAWLATANPKNAARAIRETAAALRAVRLLLANAPSNCSTRGFSRWPGGKPRFLSTRLRQPRSRKSAADPQRIFQRSISSMRASGNRSISRSMAISAATAASKPARSRRNSPRISASSDSSSAARTASKSGFAPVCRSH